MCMKTKEKNNTDLLLFMGNSVIVVDCNGWSDQTDIFIKLPIGPLLAGL